MRKIYSQSIDSHTSQLALDNLAKLLNIAKSRVLEKILNAIEVDDLAALITHKVSLKTSRVIKLDRATTQAIQDEIVSSLILLSNRVTDAASDGAKNGVISILDSEDRS